MSSSKFLCAVSFAEYGVVPHIKLRIVLLYVLFAGLSQAVNAEVVIRSTSFSYFDNGLIRKEIAEPNSSNHCLVTEYTYDNFGNKLTSTVRNCNGSNGEAPSPTGNAVFESRATTYTYTDDKRFVKTATNALGHSETKEYDDRFGKVKKLIGPNGLISEWVYDEFGRTTLEVSSYPVGATVAPAVQTKYHYCQGVNGGTHSCPTGIKGPSQASGTGTGGVAKYVVVTTPVSVNLESKQVLSMIGTASTVYYDALDRPIRKSISRPDVGSSAFGTSINTDTVYNVSGQVVYESRPYDGTSVVVWNRFDYDVLGRPTRSEFYDDQGQLQFDTNQYDGQTITTTNAKQQTVTKKTDVMGRVATVIDHDGKELRRTYDAFGNLSKVETVDHPDATISMYYDTRGRKIESTDPALGKWLYEYNALGELVKQTDAKAQITILKYDKLGRLIEKAEADLTSSWYYDKDDGDLACGASIGKLCLALASNGYNRYYEYDTWSRVSVVNNAIAGNWYTTRTTYDDAKGRILTQTYPSGFSTKFVYTPYGYLKELRKNDASNALYWQADAVNIHNQLTQWTYGNGVQTTKAINAYTGRTTQIAAGADMGVLNLSYTYDSIGNLLTRQDANQSLSETFVHDSLNRITSASVNANATGWVTTNYGYNALGNMVCKSDLSTCSTSSPNITYGASAYNGSNQAVRTIYSAVSAVAGAVHGQTNPTYKYDLNGNMTSGAGLTVSYTSFNMVKQVTHATKDGVSYLYGSEHQRIREQILNPGTLTVKERTIYLHPDMTNGLFYELQVVGGQSKHKHYLTAGGAVVAVVEMTSLTNVTTKYLHRDYQDSVVAVTNDAGAVVERYAYDAFGKRRQPNGVTDPMDLIRASATDRGYTNHEHLDVLGLINMNGRFYDPTLGRFMSADPEIAFANDLQNYNRYSYVLNNPLMLTDPSGYWPLLRSKDVRKFFRVVVSVGIGWFTGAYIAPNFGWFGAAVSSYAGGYVAGYVASGGDARAARNGAWTAVGFSFAGELSGYERAAAHAAVGCASAVSQGGDCGNGALSQLVSLAVTGQTKGMSREMGFVVSTMAGGVTSKILGGKFSDGATTAAFGYLFNDISHQERLRLIAAGGALGATAGAVVAGGCTAGTGGLCVLGTPALIGGGAAAGMATGGLIADVADWLDNILNNDYVTPDPKQGDPERFRRGPNGTKIDNENGSVWDKNKGNGHGGDQWKRWPNVKDWEKGRNRESVWPDGRIRGD